MRYLILMLVFLTGAQFDCPGRAAPPRPPFALPYVQRNLCPTPCCVYRTWTPQGDLIAHRAPSMASPFIFRVPAGRKFLAVTGEVVTLDPGVAVVHRAEGAFAKGDTLWVLCPGTEGGFTVWHKGKLRKVKLVNEKEAAPAAEEEGEGLRAVRITPQRSEWWVRARYAGRNGWIRVDPAHPRIDGVDDCG